MKTQLTGQHWPWYMGLCGKADLGREKNLQVMTQITSLLEVMMVSSINRGQPICSLLAFGEMIQVQESLKCQKSR